MSQEVAFKLILTIYFYLFLDLVTQSQSLIKNPRIISTLQYLDYDLTSAILLFTGRYSSVAGALPI